MNRGLNLAEISRRCDIAQAVFIKRMSSAEWLLQRPIGTERGTDNHHLGWSQT